MSPGNQTIAILCPHRVREPRDDSMTRRIPSEEDLAARLIGRSFSSLVVNKLTQDIGSRTDDRLRVNEGELTCLVAILGKTSVEVATLLNQGQLVSRIPSPSYRARWALWLMKECHRKYRTYSK